jgi:hypothetical protein
MCTELVKIQVSEATGVQKEVISRVISAECVSEEI